MNEKLKDTTIDLLLDGVKTKIEDVKENYKWQELFVSTGSFCVNNPDTLTMFEQDLFLVFSKDNLKQMAKKLKDKRGYEFPQLLHRELYDLMVRYEIPAMEAETYIHHFIQVIINYLEENDPDKTLEIFLGDLKKEIEKYFFALESKLELVLNQIADLKEEKVLSYSITDIDIQIRRESKYKGMGLDFFKLDDEQFESRFQSVINDERIYVVGKSREETTYRLLNELRQKNSDRVTLIIKSEEEWNKLQKANVSGNILVPFFYAEKIVAIPNNTNIFVYGEDEPCYTRDKVVLRKRTKRNIINALEEIGIDYNEAYNIVDNTHGLYVPLKKKLFNGAMYSKPDWVEGHSDVVMTALLCGEWTEATGDVLVFEELSGKTYIECKKELETYLHRENPFVVTNTSYRGSNLQLASVEDAWEELDIYITDELWSKFILLFYEVLIESEPIFDYPFEKHFEASIYAEKPEWSPTLKKGMIRTLIMRAYYRGHEENQKQIDNIVSRVLDTITSKERWGYISQYLTDLCEASPESVLRKLEDELKQPQGLLELFEANDGDFMTSRHYYTNVLWAVEQLVQQKKYVVRALEWLWKVDSYNLKYSISNSPKGVLDVVFCAWINESALSVDKKIELARKAIENYPNAWDVIASKLPQGTNSICSTLNTPKYRKIDEHEELYVHEVNKTYIEYLMMCVDSACTDAEKWNKIIQHIKSYDVTIQNEVFKKLILNCREMCDEEKIKIKNEMRYEIYRHRYYHDADWSISEEMLCKYESTMNEIVLSDKVYEYLYIFSPVYEFPLLHPVPFSREECKDLREKNHILREEEIKTRFKEFKEKKYSLEKLIKLAVKEEHSILGEVLAQFYCDGLFDEKLFILLMELDEEGKDVYDYVRYLHRNGSVDLNEVIGMVKKLSNNKNLLMNLITLEFIEDEAWYLMPKAKPYKLNRKRNIYSKILEMLQLARIIQSIHERDKAHRDIKPENILVLNGKLVLSDFGLCWGIGEERLTGLNERVGPYKIMPPELERVQTDLDLDFKPSDVYLFSKVLWMTLKGDNIGFRGQYQRGEVQIYLNKEDYDNVITLEPIHKLMEEATFEEMGKRISIQKCIEYLELQRKILNREEYELLSNEFVSQLLYDEYSKKIIACSKPDELTYKDAAIITHMLRDIIPISNIFVKSLHSDQNIKQIQITDFQVGMDGICKLLYYNKGIKIKEYLLNISKMNYSNYSSVISLELNDISLVDEGYIAYSAAGHGFGNEYPRVYFSSGEKIIIKRKENL